MPGFAHGERFRRRALDRDGLTAGNKRRWPVRRLIVARSVGIQPFEKQVLCVTVGRRETPCNAAVMSKYMERNARNGRTGNVQARRADPREIPKARCAVSQMGVIGHHGLACCGAGAGNEPGIRGRNLPQPVGYAVQKLFRQFGCIWCWQDS